MLTALYSDTKGNILDAIGYQAVASNGYKTELLQLADMIPIPPGTELMYLPARTAVVAKKERIVELTPQQMPVAAILPVGYTRTHLPAYIEQENCPMLPLYGYTAVAVYKNAVYVAAFPSDDDKKWNPHKYSTPDLKPKVQRLEQEFKENRIVQHLAGCALKWHCCTAQNLFYHRWEAGIPVSPICNANCLGCISLQPAQCCPSPQERISFLPSAQEIAQVGIYHLDNAPEPIISFGQGCEGEPSLSDEQVAPAIRQIRACTTKGIINMNTNAGYTKGIKNIIDAGLDMMRVSLISAQPQTYQAYYRASYKFEDVMASISYAKNKGVFVAVNMLLFPGLNDRPQESAAWHEFIGAMGIDMIQLRNLNIDPLWFGQSLAPCEDEPLGVKRFVNELSVAFPKLVIGNYSHFS